jgi:hypothetical protein
MPTPPSNAGDPRFAEPLFGRLVHGPDQLPATGASALGPVSHYLGGLATVLGRYDEADAYFAQAARCVRAWVRSSSPPGQTCLWGRMLAERGAPGDAEKAQSSTDKGAQPRPWPTGTGTSNDALRRHSNFWTPDGQMIGRQPNRYYRTVSPSRPDRSSNMPLCT